MSKTWWCHWHQHESTRSAWLGHEQRFEILHDCVLLKTTLGLLKTFSFGVLARLSLQCLDDVRPHETSMHVLLFRSWEEVVHVWWDAVAVTCMESSPLVCCAGMWFCQRFPGAGRLFLLSTEASACLAARTTKKLTAETWKLLQDQK